MSTNAHKTKGDNMENFKIVRFSRRFNLFIAGYLRYEGVSIPSWVNNVKDANEILEWSIWHAGFTANEK